AREDICPSFRQRGAGRALDGAGGLRSFSEGQCRSQAARGHRGCGRAASGADLWPVRGPDGGTVKAGDLLFTIDPRPLEAALRQAEANVARDTAALHQAESAVTQREA